jgi:hypothetical protein
MSPIKPARPPKYQPHDIVKSRYGKEIGRIIRVTGRRSDSVYEYQVEWSATKTTFATPETDLVEVN